MSGKVTIYCVQPYWWDGRKLALSEVRRFRTLDEAEREAGKAYARHAGVAVYSVSGWPDYDAWEDPKLVNSVGAISPFAL